MKNEFGNEINDTHKIGFETLKKIDDRIYNGGTTGDIGLIVQVWSAKHCHNFLEAISKADIDLFEQPSPTPEQKAAVSEWVNWEA